jgi:hypothetical protein
MQPDSLYRGRKLSHHLLHSRINHLAHSPRTYTRGNSLPHSTERFSLHAGIEASWGSAEVNERLFKDHSALKFALRWNATSGDLTCHVQPDPSCRGAGAPYESVYR